ncbi:NRDE family protein [Bacteroidota bacterium]
MCTVTYLPLSPEGFVLTSTRDEKSIRKPALPPRQYEIHDKKVFFPKDPDAGGTWIAVSEGDYSLCLLNGGFQIHESKPPYRMSRGLLLLDFYECNDVKGFLDAYDFQGIEPFTLIIAAHSQPTLDELRWDGEQIHHRSMDPGIPGIWSSVTLYPDEVIHMREEWFHEWLLKEPEFNIAEAVIFHKKAGTGDTQNDILMNRNEVRTVSITSVFRNPSQTEIFYEDIITGRTYHQNISGERLLVNQ